MAKQMTVQQLQELQQKPPAPSALQALQQARQPVSPALQAIADEGTAHLPADLARPTARRNKP